MSGHLKEVSPQIRFHFFSLKKKVKVRIPAAAYHGEKNSPQFEEVSSSQFWELEDAR